MGFIHPLYTVEPAIGPLLQELSLSEELGALMQYASPKGLPKHCEIGAEWIRGFGVPASPDQVFVMAGSQHALNCIFSSVFSPNDPIAVDCLTYPGIKSTAKLHHLKLEPVMMDEEGMVPESLSSLCERQSIRGVFAVGGIQNPTNYSMSQRRREELCAVMEQHDLILVEDDMYQFLSAVPNQALSRLIPNRSIYLSSLSRAFFNGLRVAFVSVPQHCCSAMSQSILDSIWLVSQLCAELACRAITGGMAATIMEHKRVELSQRGRMLLSILEQYTVKWRENSMFAWLKLPPCWASKAFEQAADQKGVHVYASDKFTIGNFAPPDCVRLSISSPPDQETLRRGLLLLKDLLQTTPN